MLEESWGKKTKPTNQPTQNKQQQQHEKDIATLKEPGRQKSKTADFLAADEAPKAIV